jgi:hypothetical protein
VVRAVQSTDVIVQAIVVGVLESRSLGNVTADDDPTSVSATHATTITMQNT